MRTRITALAFVAAFAAGGVQAQQAQQVVPADLKSLVERAWERSAAARTLEGERVEADASRAQAAGMFAGSPAIGLSDRSDRWTDRQGARETELAISAPIWLPGQRAAREALAVAEAGQADTAIAVLKLSIAGKVRDTVWALAAADAEVALARQRTEVAAALEADVARRVKAGDLARADALLARQETLSAQAALHEAEIRRTEVAARLEVLTGFATVSPHYEEVQASEAPDTHPRILAAKAASDRAQQQLRFVSTTRRDAPEVGLSYRWDRSGNATPTDHSVGISVRIPLATDARNRPRETAAQTEAATAAAEERTARDSVQADIRAAQVALDHAESLARLSVEHLAAARDRAALIQKAFDLGDQSLTELLRAQAGAREAQIAYERHRAALGLARARLNQSRGILP